MTVRIRFRPGGPLTIHGPIELVDEDNKPIDLGERKVVVLCRCGASRAQPFCDGTHNRLPCPTEGPDKQEKSAQSETE